MASRLPDRAFRPRVEVTERPEHYRVVLELPLGAEGEVQLDLRDGVLRLASHALPEQGRAGLAGARAGWGMTVDFGDLLSGDDLSAVQRGGRLVVALPKAAASDTAPRADASGGDGAPPLGETDAEGD